MKLDIKSPTRPTTPYENNSELNDSAVKAVVTSINKFGFFMPIVNDKNYVIFSKSLLIG